MSNQENQETQVSINSVVVQLQSLLSAKNRIPNTNRIPKIVCNDGSFISVQASEGHYCSPRADTGPYSSVEVYSERTVRGWKGYADSETVYGYVPIKKVAAEIVKRGGIAV